MEEILLRMTRSRQMALLEVLICYVRLGDEPQEFVNCSTDPPTTTTTGELLSMIAEAGKNGKA